MRVSSDFRLLCISAMVIFLGVDFLDAIFFAGVLRAEVLCVEAFLAVLDVAFWLIRSFNFGRSIHNSQFGFHRIDVTNGLISDSEELKRRRANFQTVIKGLARRREDIDIIAKDMREIVDIIDDHLDNTQEEPSVQNLAAKYEAAFKKSFAHSEGGQGYSFDYQADDFAPAE